ncbi:sulfite reductase subunit alpha [Suttonella sp. R2A3]|uniref:sulfite reductase subunit alpha n=1 Tax=Suttonella sp. R2A3 TaxID=2908648 RepID=UPI001F36AEB1|nr:sulfite reductase subunit alpha [Suttonella sp. R2A3]UJF25125.1 sulfite reductase subunit alpha [Suttonella sp. R2A3]
MNQNKKTPLFPQDLPLDQGQRQWLEGYLAGLDAAYAALRANGFDGTSASGKPLTILYGSQTGNAEGLAWQCAEAAKAHDLAASVVDMDDFDLADLPSIERLLVITSTYGEGEMPDNGETLWQAIQSDDAPALEQTFFSVLALGDTAYEHFCLAGKQWDARLAALGGERVSDRVDCDVDFDQAAEAWIEAVLPAISEKGSQETVSAASAAQKPQGYNRSNPLEASLKSKRVLSGAGSSKEIVHYEIDLADSGETYEAGDILHLIPRNRQGLVDELLAAIGANGNESVSWQGDNHELASLLRDQLDIRMPSSTFLQALLIAADDDDLHQRFAQEKGTELDDFLYGKDIVDFLHAYPDAGFDAQSLVDVLKPIAPRAYSISSSHNQHPGEVHLTIGSVRYEHNARMHHGVASTWLADEVSAGDTLRCYFAANKHFSVPADDSAPMIMVGPGTGIAPFRAFLEERGVREAEGDNWLFFGDRTREHDYIYADTLESWQQNGLLTRLDLAFSRDQAEKVYVQDLMRKEGAELFAWLERGGYFFVCGDALRMAKDVDHALHDIIAEHGKMSADDAADYVAALKQAKRYVRDVY